MHTFPPHEILNKAVHHFFSIDDNAQRPTVNSLMPNGMPFIFYLESDQNIEARFSKGDPVSVMGNCLYLGYLSGLVDIVHHKIRVLGASLSPIYLGVLFKITPSRILNTITPLRDVTDESTLPDVRALRRLSRQEVFLRIEDFLIQRLFSNPLRSDIEAIYHKVVREKGYTWSVKELAEYMGFTTRHVFDLFRKHTGLSPKKFIQLVRFHEGMKQLSNRNHVCTLAQIACELGYHDQAHFIKDVKNICGKTPSQLLKDRSVQHYKLL